MSSAGTLLQLSMTFTFKRKVTIVAEAIVVLVIFPWSHIGLAEEQHQYKWKFQEGRDLELVGPRGTICKLVFDQEEGKPFFHPLNALDGTTITGLRPSDHPHHLGLWFSWKFINGADYWSDPSVRNGITRLDRISLEQTDADEAKVICNLSYHRKDEAPILKEHRQIRISVPTPEQCYRIDWELNFEALEDVALSATPLEESESGGYAGLAYRPISVAKLTKDMEPEWLNSAGHLDRGIIRRPYREMKLHAEAANWCDISLRFGGEHGKVHGLAIFSHPDNFRSPPKWHVAAPTGFFNPMPLYDGSWSISKGEKFDLRYRVFVHPGRGDAEQLNREYNDFLKQSLKGLTKNAVEGCD